MNLKTLSVVITGRVQGVSFRAWTKGQAEAFGLAGWVRNAPDGSVHALLHGPAEPVDAMAAALWQGPPAARVTQVQIEPADPPPDPGFVITG